MPASLNPREYVSRSGACCPVCESTDVTTEGSPEFDGAVASQGVRCDSCGAVWDDLYQLTGYDSLVHGSTPTLPVGLLGFAEFQATGHLASNGNLIEYAGGLHLTRHAEDQGLWVLDNAGHLLEGERHVLERALFTKFYLPDVMRINVHDIEAALCVALDRLKLSESLDGFTGSAADKAMAELVVTNAQRSQVRLDVTHTTAQHVDLLQHVACLIA